MTSNRFGFAEFAKYRLGAEVYEPGERTEENQAFLIALQSFSQLMGWTNGLHNQLGDQRRIECGYIERMTPNALADRYQGVHCIGLHQAMLVSCAEFALYAFTQPAVFPQIGNAAGEVSPELQNAQVPGLLLLGRTLQGEIVHPQQDRARVPNDKHRHVAAIYLTMIMVRYIYLHELAHCTNGHVSYVQNEGLEHFLFT